MMINIIKKVGIVLGFTILIFGLFFVYSKLKEKSSGRGNVYVEFISTKDDADATLICQDGMAILIDTGEECDAETILDTLDNYNIKKIDYLVFSHGDKDHIGSAEQILDSVEVDKVIAPYYSNSEKFDELLDSINSRNIPIIYPAHNMHIDAGELDIICYPALENNYTDENNYSLAVLVRHKDVKMLFTGDALRVRSEELEKIHWDDITLYKVPYHGRANSASIDLFEKVNPRIAVVTSDKCDEEITTASEKCKSELYFTRPDGVTFMSDGNILFLLD